MFFTDDPVRDQMRYEAGIEEMDAKREYITCDRCGGKIYKRDEFYDGDSYYEIEGQNLCEDCAVVWLEDQRVRHA